MVKTLALAGVIAALSAPARAQTCTRDSLKIELIQAVFGGRTRDAIWPDEKK